MKVQERGHRRIAKETVRARTLCTPVQECGAIFEEVLGDVCHLLQRVRHLEDVGMLFEVASTRNEFLIVDPSVSYAPLRR